MLARRPAARIRDLAAVSRRTVTRNRAALRLRDLVLRVGKRNVWVTREDLARRYVSGQGIEIGALTAPLRVPPGVCVRHVDRLARADLLRELGPALIEAGDDPDAIPEISAVADASTLSGIADGSLDFVIANHVLGHLEDPVAALENLLRVLRPRRSPPAHPARYSPHLRCRPVADHARARPARPCGGPRGFAANPLRGVGAVHRGVAPDRIAERAPPRFARIDARHHFHVWRLADFLALLLAVPLPAEIVHAQAYLREFAVVLRRTPEEPRMPR